MGRLHIPGGYYHVLGRGLERRNIFSADTDKEDLLSRVGYNLARYGMQCMAWAVMSNHYHLLVRVGSIPLSKAMASVLGGFAGFYNRRHNRCGYVFQNRYTSILCDESSYLLELIRYIHLNPLRASMLSREGDLIHYPWTGHAGICTGQQRPWHGVDEVLALFGTDRSRAIARYRAFIAAGLDQPGSEKYAGGGLIRSHGGWEELSRRRKEHQSCIGDERVLGDSSFVNAALEQDQLRIDERSRLQREGWDLEHLITRVCQYCDIEESRLFERSRQGAPSRAKAMICYVGTRKLGLTCRQIADRLCISQPAVSKWTDKGCRLRKEADEVIGSRDI